MISAVPSSARSARQPFRSSFAVTACWQKPLAALVLGSMPFMTGCASLSANPAGPGVQPAGQALTAPTPDVQAPLDAQARSQEKSRPPSSVSTGLPSGTTGVQTAGRTGVSSGAGRLPLPAMSKSVTPVPSSTGQAASTALRASSPNGIRRLPSAALGTESLKPVHTDEIAITLGVGQAHLLNVGVVRRAAVGNGRVLQVNALDNRQLLLLPESVGESSLHLWLGHGEIRKYRIHVTAQNQQRQVEEINALLGADSGVIARLAGNRVVLEGERPTEEGSYRVGEVLKRYPNVVSLVSRTGFERMVNLEVKMIEVSRNALKQLGVRWHSGAGAWSMAGPSFGVIGDFKRSAALMPGGAAEAAAQAAGLSVLPRVSPFATSVSMASSLRSMIDLMVQNGDAAVLAEPRLSTRSGGNARFVAGGELPLPVLGGNGSASVQFKEYGVRFDVSPTVNARGIISASLHTEISSINEDVVVQGMPGLRKQSASTDVNLRPGQTLVIAGMVSQEMTGAVEKIPGLGDLPILGHLFRSKRFRNRESEMIVLITPQLAGEQEETLDPRLAPIESRFQQIRERVGMLD